MKSSKGKTVITIETFQRTTIRSRKAAKIVRCEQSAADAPSESAAHLQEAVREILQLKEAGEASCAETVTDPPQVWSKST